MLSPKRFKCNAGVQADLSAGVKFKCYQNNNQETQGA